MKLVCVGDVGVDRYMPENKLLPGGITANFTRQARRWFSNDTQIDLISILGNNYPDSDVAYSAVNIDGINCHINRTKGDTPTQYIEILQGGEKNFTHYDVGVLKHFSLSDEQENIIKAADIVMTPVYWQIKNVFDIVMAVNRAGTVAVDFSDFSTDPDFELLEKHIDKINIAFFGLSIDQSDMIEKLSTYAKHNDILIVITLGENGSTAYRGTQKYHAEPYKVRKVIDTTGAGDAFAAGFLSKYLTSDIEVCLSVGAKAAGKTIEQMGSVPA